MRTIDRRSVTSRYHGNSHVSMVPLDVKNLSSQIRTYGSMGCRVVPESNLVQESHTCVYTFLIGHYKTTVCWDPEIFQPWHCDVNRRKFKPSMQYCTFSQAGDSKITRPDTTLETRRCVPSPRSEVDITVFSLLILWNLRILTHSPFRREHWLLSLCRRNSFLPHSW